MKLWLLSACWIALAASAMLGQAPTFDVATVKPSHATDGHIHVYRHPDDGGFQAIDISLKSLLAFAYGMPDSRILGGPAWIDTDRWDVEAKSGAEMDARFKADSDDLRRSEKRQMVQALLAERFLLAVHREPRVLPIYALVLLKGGPKFQPTKENGTSVSSGNGRIAVQGGDSMGILAEQLAQATGRAVVDRTGIQGRFDITLRWTPENAAADAEPGLSLFTAVQEQLGLKLEAGKGPVEVLVVDKVEKPTEN